ncbi:hypothetical protein J2755_000291 [Methanohalophilus levihalophilus]|uniref:hypothetical protein n=1 Tax=Methanohalophilus levihalophilus TaxID=1431282 RepID=UPI001AE14398|nr:hypothetical protein [Methanohalophilus levihalophilus]MBP2029371.1 hypothetical protein [Methanohalophilus levihalophilus]
MSLAVTDENGNVQIIHESGIIPLTFPEYINIRKSFEEGFILTDAVIRPSAVINYLDENNPRLIEAEVQIEKEKFRRRFANGAMDMMKWAFPIIVLLIGAAIAFKMLDSGSAGSALSSAANAASSGATIN